MELWAPKHAPDCRRQLSSSFSLLFTFLSPFPSLLHSESIWERGGTEGRELFLHRSFSSPLLSAPSAPFSPVLPSSSSSPSAFESNLLLLRRPPPHGRSLGRGREGGGGQKRQSKVGGGQPFVATKRGKLNENISAKNLLFFFHQSHRRGHDGGHPLLHDDRHRQVLRVAPREVDKVK